MFILSSDNTAFATVCGLPTARKLRSSVKRPTILTLADLRRQLEPLRTTRQVYLQFCGDDDRCVPLATVTVIRFVLKQVVEYPEQSSAYVVTGTTRDSLNAWPIIWQGAVGPKYTFVAYVDPVRYGFKSLSDTFLTIGPPSPTPVGRRKRGLWIVYDFVKREVRFEPIEDGAIA